MGGIVGVNKGIDLKISSIHRVAGLQLKGAAKAQSGNFLLVGSDSRQFEDQLNGAAQAQAASQFGSTANQGGQRSDTIMIVHVDPSARRTLLVSIPRDTWVNIPGVGMQKVNSAFNYGPQKLVDTIESNFGVPINHYVEINFTAFEAIVNAIGTVPIYFSAPAHDHDPLTGANDSGLSVPAAGCYHFNGQQALGYVRTRHLQYYVDGRWRDADPLSDLDRIQRQQAFIRKLASMAYQKATSDPFAANTIANDVVAKLTVDTGLRRGQILGLVNAFRNVDPSTSTGLETATLPTNPKTITYQGAQLDILTPKQPDAEALLQRLRTFGAAPAPPKGVLPSLVHLRILNGSGVNGAAGRALDTLGGQYGFVPAGTGNAARASTTQVRYAPGAQAKAQVVASYLGGVGRLVPDPTIAGADVVVVIGADFQSVQPPPGVSAGAAGTASTTTAPGAPAPQKSTAPGAEAACV